MLAYSLEKLLDLLADSHAQMHISPHVLMQMSENTELLMTWGSSTFWDLEVNSNLGKTACGEEGSILNQGLEFGQTQHG